MGFCLKPYKSLQNALKYIYTLWCLIPGISFTEERHASSYGICLYGIVFLGLVRICSTKGRHNCLWHLISRIIND